MSDFPHVVGQMLVAVFLAAMLLVSWWVARRRPLTLDSFLVADREIGPWAAALSIAGSWVWAPALFLSSQKAFQQGVAGLFWFTAANVLCLLLFAPLAVRIRRALPDGYTLPQFIRQRLGPAVHRVYLFQFVSLQVCSFAIQLLAGAVMVELLTGIPAIVGGTLLTAGVVAYAWIGGMRASVATDVIQTAMILVACAVIVPWTVVAAGGLDAVTAGLGGASGQFTSLFNADVAYSFGIVVSIGLLAGPIGDQQHWQRAFSVREGKAQQAFVRGAFIFALVPLSLALLGFVGAGLVAGGELQIADAQMAGPTVVAHLLPRAALGLFLVMLLAGLTSTMDSALIAAGSMGAVDVYRVIADRREGEQTPQATMLRVSRWTVLGVALFGFAVAQIPGLKILHLFLFYGTLRAGTMIPTVLTLFMREVSPRAVFVGVVVSWTVGLPGFIFGALTGNVHAKVAATVFVVLFSGLSTWLGTMWRRRAAPVTQGS